MVNAEKEQRIAIWRVFMEIPHMVYVLIGGLTLKESAYDKYENHNEVS